MRRRRWWWWFVDVVGGSLGYAEYLMCATHTRTHAVVRFGGCVLAGVCGRGTCVWTCLYINSRNSVRLALVQTYLSGLHFRIPVIFCAVNISPVRAALATMNSFSGSAVRSATRADNDLCAGAWHWCLYSPWDHVNLSVSQRTRVRLTVTNCSAGRRHR